VSIHILTYNAPNYVRLTVGTLVEKTVDPAYEIVIVDNGSQAPTRQALREIARIDRVRTVKFLNRNSLFAEGNNIAAALASTDATHFLLLNSDVEVERSDWLSNLLRGHKKGISAYGFVDKPWPRADGWCVLIDSDVYRRYCLDEAYQWWWSITKLQAQLLNDGYSVRAFRNYEQYIHHFGGKSGNGYLGARGMELNGQTVQWWFRGKEINMAD
jgi:glycosyltransferase involved in cell wall biosynthesis